MEKIRQEHHLGCGAAAIASVLGLSYKETIKFFKNGRKRADTFNFYSKEIIKVLEKTDKRYKARYIKPRLRNKIYQKGTIVCVGNPKKHTGPGDLSNFAYLFFKTGDENDANKDELQFGFGDWAYENMKEIAPKVEEFVKFYRSIKGFDKKKNLKDLSVFNNNTISQFVSLIEKTAKKLKQE